MSDRGQILVISGPSGAGKSTVISRVMKKDPNIVFSVSATTRPPREGEKDGIDYRFIDKENFKSMIEADKFLEFAQYVDNYYGSPKEDVFSQLDKGQDVLFDIEVQGAMQIKSKCPQAILIFLIPSSFQEIERRLRARGTDSEEKISLRLMTAREEYKRALVYDYIVINDNPDSAAAEIEAIVRAEKCRMSKRKQYLSEV